MSPLSGEERQFAEDNHHIIAVYLRSRGLPVDEWYDVVVFRYLRAVQLWLSRPDLHRWSFMAIACQNMRSAIGNERQKQARRIQPLSLDAEVPGTDGQTYGDTVTHENLEFIYWDREMEVSYNVQVPERRYDRGKAKSDERIAIEGFIAGKWKNMCFEYETSEEAKKKTATIQSARRHKKETEIYDCWREGTRIYIVRKKCPDHKGR